MANTQKESCNLNSQLKKQIVKNQAFFTAITFSRINSFAYIDSIIIYTSLTRPI